MPGAPQARSAGASDGRVDGPAACLHPSLPRRNGPASSPQGAALALPLHTSQVTAGTRPGASHAQHRGHHWPVRGIPHTPTHTHTSWPLTWGAQTPLLMAPPNRCPARVSESHCLRDLKPCPRSHRVTAEPALGPGLPVPTPGCVHITDCWAGSPHTCRGPATVPSEPLWGETSHHRGHCLHHGAQSSLHDTLGFCPCPSQHPHDPSRPLGLQNEAGDPWDPLAHKAPTPALGFGQAPVAGVSWVRVQLPRAVPRKLSLS